MYCIFYIYLGKEDNMKYDNYLFKLLCDNDLVNIDYILY